MKFLPILAILLILVVGCGSSNDTDPGLNQTYKGDVVKSRVENIYKKMSADVEIEQQRGFFDVTVQYDAKSLMSGKSLEKDKQKIVDETFNQVRRISLADPKIRVITIKIITQSPFLGLDYYDTHLIGAGEESIIREATSLEITTDEFKELSAKSNAKQLLKDMIVEHPYYKIDRYLQMQKGIAKSFFVQTRMENDSNETIAEITYIPANIDSFQDGNFDSFENSIASIARTAFTEAQEVNRVELTVISNLYDNRTENNTPYIAQLNLTRKEFNDIMVNWDNLRSQIYDKIAYNPLSLLDLKLESKIEKMTFGSTVKVDLFIPEYIGIDEIINQLEKDSTEGTYAIFDRFPQVNKVVYTARIVIPAPEGEVTIDGVHKIVSDAFTVGLSRSDVSKINRETLTYRQVLYNFGPVWDKSVLELNLGTKLGYGNGMRLIDLSTDLKSLELRLDTCNWERLEKNKANLIENVLVSVGHTALFNIHPPYLKQVSVFADKVFIDQYGNEEVESLARVTLEKNNDADWFNPDIEDLSEWYEVTIRENDITDDTVLCQIKTT